MIQPTKILLKWGAILIVLYLLTHIDFGLFGSVLLFFWLSLPIYALLMLILRSQIYQPQVKADRAWVVRGEVARWTFSFEKSRFTPDVIVQSPIGAIKKDRLSLVSEHCGILAMPECRIHFESEFGFFKRTVTFVDHKQSIVVVPRLDKQLEFDKTTLSQYAKQVYQIKLLADERDEIDQLKQGESLRSVHWKLSAKRHQFIVKRESAYSPMSAHLWLVFETTMTHQHDLFLDLASTLCSFWLEQGYQLLINQRIYTNISDVLIALAQMESMHHQNTTVISQPVYCLVEEDLLELDQFVKQLEPSYLINYHYMRSHHG